MESLVGKVFALNQKLPCVSSLVLKPPVDDHSAVPQLERKAESFADFLVEFPRTPSREGPLWGCLLSDFLLGLDLE